MEAYENIKKHLYQDEPKLVKENFKQLLLGILDKLPEEELHEYEWVDIVQSEAEKLKNEVELYKWRME